MSLRPEATDGGLVIEAKLGVDREGCLELTVEASPPSCYRKKRHSVAPSGAAASSRQGPAFSVSMRHAFVPFSGDYDHMHICCVCGFEGPDSVIQEKMSKTNQ